MKRVTKNHREGTGNHKNKNLVSILLSCHFVSCVCHVFLLESFSAKWREILRILPLGETEVHLQDMNTGELGILVQNHAQNREVGAEAGKEAEAVNVFGTWIAISFIV